MTVVLFVYQTNFTIIQQTITSLYSKMLVGEPRLHFDIILGLQSKHINGAVYGADHRFICLVQCGLSLTSSNLSRDASTLLRYPSTRQIRLLACWQRVGAGSAGQIIERCSPSVSGFRGNPSYTLTSHGFRHLLFEKL